MDSTGLRQLAKELADTKQDFEIGDLIDQAKVGSGELSNLNLHELNLLEREVARQ